MGHLIYQGDTKIETNNNQEVRQRSGNSAGSDAGTGANRRAEQGATTMQKYSKTLVKTHKRGVGINYWGGSAATTSICLVFRP